MRRSLPTLNTFLFERMDCACVDTENCLCQRVAILPVNEVMVDNRTLKVQTEIICYLAG